MIYIIYGEEKYLIKQKLDAIINDNNESSVFKFDGSTEQFSYADVVFCCRNVDLFSNKNLVIVKDPMFLIKKLENGEIDSLVNYCLNPCYETDLILYTINYNFNERLKTFKDIKTNAQCFRFDKIQTKNFYQYALNMINDYKLNITKEAKEFLISDNKMSFDILKNNLDVLSLYPELIDINVIKKLITYPDEEDVYNLINCIIEKDISASLRYARKIIELNKENDSIPGLIGLLATKLRFIYNVYYYNSIGKSIYEIADIYNYKYTTPIKRALESLTHFNSIAILKLIDKLSDLDYQIKTNNSIDANEAFELFIVGIVDEKD